jgi:hypothetical protein
LMPWSSVSEPNLDLILLEEFVPTETFGPWLVGEACGNHQSVGAASPRGAQ